MGETVKRYNSILEIIDKRLIPDEKAKKARGEVFTPLNLVREMLFGIRKSSFNQLKDKIPEVRSEEYLKIIWGIDEKGNFIDDNEDDRIGGIPLPIWRDPKGKWLDPANGIGNFPVIAFYMLDYQLGKHATGEDAKKLKGDDNKVYRRRHIVKNMLYMIELNKGNVNTSRKIFEKIVPGVTANICCANTLEITHDKLMSLFGINKFHTIMGNPPFQAYQEAEGKRGGGDELYMKFVKKSIDLLVPNGLLIFVHPPSWRKPEFNEGRKKSKNAGMFELMAHENQLIYLEIHDSKDGVDVFKAGTRYDFYIMKKTKANSHTTIKDMHGKIYDVDLRDFEFLPNFNIKNVLKLFPKKTEHICDLGKFNENTKKYETPPCVLYERSAYGSDKAWVSQGKTAQYKYPLIHATLKEGAKIFYSNTQDKGFFGVPKVIFGDGGINEPFIDMEGKYGMTQHAIGLVIKDKKDADKLKTFLQSNFFKNILSACMYSGFQIDWRIFTYFKRNFWDIDIDLNEPLLDSNGKEKGHKPPKTAKAKGGAPSRNHTRKIKRT